MGIEAGRMGGWEGQWRRRDKKKKKKQRAMFSGLGQDLVVLREKEST